MAKRKRRVTVSTQLRLRRSVRGPEQDWELLRKWLAREAWRMRGMAVTIQFRPRLSVSGSERN